MRTLIQYLKFRYRQMRPVQYSPTIDIEREQEFMQIHRACRSYTVTAIERQFMLFKMVEYVVKRRIAGDFVECGVMAGGSAMIAALALQHFGDTSRHLHLYDTFAGMTQPVDHDQRLLGVENGPFFKWRSLQRDTHNEWCYCPLEQVQAHMATTGYPAEKIHYIQGDVAETLTGPKPEQVAILRLDTDFYESTRQEMVHLYPRLVPGGLLLLDDYGLWLGSRKAVDDYFQQSGEIPLLCRIDKGGRAMVKMV